MTLTFKIQIRNIKKPPVWRRIEIPGNFTFHDFHRAIQEAFGWEDYHLYQFQQQPYDQGWSLTVPNEEAVFGMDYNSTDSRSMLVDDFVKSHRLTKFVYVYDFGDDWIHDITLEKSDDKRMLKHPVCLSGKGLCPPEDCGGPWGYEDMKRMLAEEPDDEETKDWVEWLGLDDPREFDPNEFDINETNNCLKMVKASEIIPAKGKKDVSGNQEGQHAFLQMMENFHKMVGNMSEEELEQLSDLISGKSDMAEAENAKFYSYKKPDYAKKAAKELGWLEPFWNVTDEDDKLELCHRVEEDFKQRKMTIEQATEDMRGYMNKLFAEFDKNDLDSRWKLFGPLWLMERLEMTDCLDLVLEALRQDAYFVHFYIMRVEEWPAAVVYQLGKDKPEVLESFLYEQGIMPDGKPVVLMALVWIWLRQPEKRIRITAMLSKFMSHCLSICKKGASPLNLETYAITLATAHVKEAMPILKKMFSELNIPTLFITDGADEVEHIMNNSSEEYRCKYDNIDDFLHDSEEMEFLEATKPLNARAPFANADDDYDDDDYDDDDDFNYNDIFDDIVGYYDIEEKSKRYEIRIEQKGKEMMLQVPSNITLDGLLHVIMLANGQEDMPEYYEFADEEGFRFLPDADDHALEKDYWEMDGTDYSTVSQLLYDKGGTATLKIKKGKRFAGSFTLTLEKVGRYTSKTPERIDLLWADNKADEAANRKLVRQFAIDNPPTV